MIRCSEMVLPGHPDKLCDQIADAIVAECYRADAEAYCQVEASCWSDEVWLTGGVVTRRPLGRPLEEIVRAVGRRIGYVEGNAIVADRYHVRSSVCVELGDPARWTHKPPKPARTTGRILIVETHANRQRKASTAATDPTVFPAPSEKGPDPL